MRKAVTKDDLIKVIKRYEPERSIKLSDYEIDQILDRAYGEVLSVRQPYSAEDSVDLLPYAEDGVQKMSYDVEDQVIGIYQLELQVADSTIEDYKGVIHREGEVTISKDNRVSERVNIELFNIVSPGILTIKYTFSPTSATQELLLTTIDYGVLIDAIGVATYSYFHNTEKVVQHLASMNRLAARIVSDDPYDLEGADQLKKFPIGV